jgi:hypothetical protein
MPLAEHGNPYTVQCTAGPYGGEWSASQDFRIMTTDTQTVDDNDAKRTYQEPTAPGLSPLAISYRAIHCDIYGTGPPATDLSRRDAAPYRSGKGDSR